MQHFGKQNQQLNRLIKTIKCFTRYKFHLKIILVIDFFFFVNILILLYSQYFLKKRTETNEKTL